jgi:hypothetical protein
MFDEAGVLGQIHEVDQQEELFQGELSHCDVIPCTEVMVH